MKNKKFISRLIGIILFVSFCTPINPVFAEVSDVNRETLAVGLLKRLDVLRVEEGFDVSAPITKYDFIELVLRMIGCDNTEDYQCTRQIFFDVPVQDSCAGQVETAYNLGIIFGNSDGRLDGQRTVSIDEAITMTIRALRSGKLAELMGGYFSGYNNLANQYKLYQDVERNNDIISWSDAAQIVYNAMMLEVTYNQNNLKYNMSLMTTRYDLKKVEGIVTGNSYAKLYSNGDTSKNEVEIDGVSYGISDEFDGKMLGHHVKAYCVKDDKKEDKIIYMVLGREKSLVLDAENVSSYLPGEITYYSGKKETRKKATVSKSAITLKNGGIVSVMNDGLAVPNNGSFELIDNNDDGLYDVILVDECVSGPVTLVDLNSEIIYTDSICMPKVDLSQFDRVYPVDSNNHEIELSSINKNDLIEVYKSDDGRVVKIQCIKEQTTIRVSETSIKYNNSGKPYYYIKCKNNAEYRTVAGFLKDENGDVPEPRKTYTVVFDRKGHIAYMRSSSAENDIKLGYIIGIYHPSFDELTLKLFSTDGAEHIYEVSDKVLYVNNKKRYDIDGIAAKIDALLKASENKKANPGLKPVIRYECNRNDEITAIEIPQMENEQYDGCKYCSVPDWNTNENAYRYYSSTNLLGGKIVAGNQTIVMTIPSDELDDSSAYAIKNKTYFKDQMYYPDSTAYKLNDNTVYADLIVVPAKIQKIGRDTSRMLVTDVYEAYDETNGIAKKAIKGYVSGEERSYMLNSEELLEYKPKNEDADGIVTVECGDTIRYSLGYNNEICGLEIVYDESKQKVYVEGTTLYGSDLVILSGQVASVNDNYIKVVVDETLTNEAELSDYYFPLSTISNIYEYDSNARKKNTAVRKINAGDILSLRNDAELKDRFVMMTSYNNIVYLVIYK